jgi:hypothetical protein
MKGKPPFGGWTHSRASKQAAVSSSMAGIGSNNHVFGELFNS